jgi:hypothetical protein
VVGADSVSRGSGEAAVAGIVLTSLGVDVVPVDWHAARINMPMRLSASA